MAFVAALAGGGLGLLWIWGALSGRLASMVAGAIDPAWVGLKP